MKNKSNLAMTVFSLCMLAAVPASAAEISGDNLEEQETIRYIVDFLDDDGNILDSKICTYGDVLEDIRTPDPREDEQYIYQFAGWEPEVSKVVTESALYTAVYRRISKADGEVSDILPREVLDEIPAASVSGDFYSGDFCPEKEVQQVTATSYDVVPFHIETKEEPDASDEPAEERTEPSAFTSVVLETVLPEKKETADSPEMVNEQITVFPKESPETMPEETLAKTESAPIVLAEVHSAAENPALAEESANAKISTVNADKSKPKISEAPEKIVRGKKNKAQKRKQSPPVQNTEEFALRESRQETKLPFSIPVFLAGVVVSGAVCMKGRRALWEK